MAQTSLLHYILTCTFCANNTFLCYERIHGCKSSMQKILSPKHPFFTGLTVFQFSTLNGAYCGTTQGSTQAEGKQPEDRSRIVFFSDWWLSGCLCCAERHSWKRIRMRGQSGPFPCGVTTLEDIGTCQILIPAEASHSSRGITLSS